MRLFQALIILAGLLEPSLLLAGQSYTDEHPVPKKALVIAISDYAHENAVPSAKRDEVDVAEKLSSLGFRVVRASDSDKKTSTSILHFVRGFFRSIQSGDVVLVYFSGHGFWFQGNNYLVPSQVDNANPPHRPGSTEPEAPSVMNVPVTEIVNYAENVDAGEVTVVVDACRNAPRFPMTKLDSFVRKGAALDEASSLLFFSSQEGYYSEGSSSPSENSEYTKYFLRYLDEHGLSEMDVHGSAAWSVKTDTQGQQKPVIGGVYYGSVYLNPSKETLTREKLLWEAVLASGDEESVRKYIATSPGSRFVAAARRWLVDRQTAPRQVEASAVDPQAVESALVVSPTFGDLTAAKPSGSLDSSDIFAVDGSVEYSGTQFAAKEVGSVFTLGDRSEPTITPEIPRATASKPQIVAQNTITGFKLPDFSSPAALVLNKGDLLTLDEVVRNGTETWAHASTKDGKTVYIPGVRVSNNDLLRSAARIQSRVIFDGPEVLAPAETNELSRTVEREGPGNISGVSVRIIPSDNLGRKYGEAVAQLRLTELREQLIKMGVRRELIGGIIGDGGGSEAANTAQVTMALKAGKR